MGIGTIYVDCVYIIKATKNMIELISKNESCMYIDLFSAYIINDSLVLLKN